MDTAVVDNIFYDEDWEGTGTLQARSRANVYLLQWRSGFPLEVNGEAADTLDQWGTWDGKQGDWGPQ